MQQEKWKNKAMIRINLIKTEKKAPPPEEVEKEKKPVPTSLIIGLFVVILAALFFLQRSAISKERALLDVAQEEKTKLQDVLVKLDQVEKQKALIVKKIDLINQLKSHQQVAVKIMDELSKNIPYWVWLTELNYDKQLLHIKGRAMSNDLIADYIYNLETSPSFSNVNLISSTKRTIRGSEFLEFALNARCVIQEKPKLPPEETTKEKK